MIATYSITETLLFMPKESYIKRNSYLSPCMAEHNGIFHQQLAPSIGISLEQVRMIGKIHGEIAQERAAGLE